MQKTAKKNMAQVAQQLNKQQIVDQKQTTAIKGGDVVIDDILL